MGVAKGDLRDMRDVEGLETIVDSGDGVEIGARATVAAVAAHSTHRSLPRVAAAAAARDPRDPGSSCDRGSSNLLQEVRCWYYRNPDTRCLKRGGAECLARDGDNLYSG